MEVIYNSIIFKKKSKLAVFNFTNFWKHTLSYVGMHFKTIRLFLMNT